MRKIDPILIHGVLMDAQSTISLRDVALRLARLPKSGTGKVADGKLLGLLQAGELQAGFHFPGEFASWIPISRTYWSRVSSDKFRSIRKSERNNLSGVFKVRLSEVADDCVEVMSGRWEIDQREDPNSIWNEIRATLAVASHRFEVLIREQDWDDYLNKHDLEEPMPVRKSKGGRHPKGGWRDLCVLVGAYIVKHQRTTKEEFKIEEAARQIHKMGKDADIPDLPAWPTIKDVLSAIYSRAAGLSIN
jgi:hypothetical protein